MTTLHTDREFLVANLRERIEQRHAHALEALSLLDEYLAAGDNEPLHDESPQLMRIEVAVRALSGYCAATSFSHRQLVIDAISDDWLTVREVSERTGLTQKQARGVLYAPKLKGIIRRKNAAIAAGETRFRAER